LPEERLSIDEFHIGHQFLQPLERCHREKVQVYAETSMLEPMLVQRPSQLDQVLIQSQQP